MFKPFRTIFAAAALALLISSDSRLAAAGVDNSEKPARFAAWRGVESFTGEGSVTFNAWAHDKDQFHSADQQTVETTDVHFELKRSGLGSTMWHVVNCKAAGTHDY